MITSFKTFISEVTNTDKKDLIENIINTIKRDCKIYLENNNKRNSLYRGISKNFSSSFKNKYFNKLYSRSRKEPLHTNKLVNDYFNKVFEEKHGISNIRDVSIYVTVTKETAEDYGNIFIVFPIGDYNIWYNERVNDLFFKLRSTKNEPELVHDYAIIDKYVSGYQATKNIEELEINNVEGMLLCKEYYVLKYDEFSEDEVYQILGGIYEK